MWSIEQAEWTCKIDEGSAGLAAARWAPDSRHILTTADFQLRITLWSLVNKSVSYIKYPKMTHGGLDFTKDGRYMALAERRDSKDQISIFDCHQWSLLSHFDVATKDLAGLSWSPDGRLLIVWDSVVDYALHVYAMDGLCLVTYSPYSHMYEFGLGIKSVSWSPTGQFLAIGSFDETVRMLNNITWKPVAEHHHSPMVEDGRVVIYVEQEKKSVAAATAMALMKEELLSGRSSNIFPIQSKYEAQEPPVAIPSIKPDPEKPNPKLGVGAIRFSSDGRYVATINDNMPTAVWIWDMTKLCLSVVLQQTASVKDFRWDPTQSRLALCSGNNRLYMWSPAGCISVMVPSDPPLTVNKLAWHPDGIAIIIKGQTHFALCYLRQEN